MLIRMISRPFFVCHAKIAIYSGKFFIGHSGMPFQTTASYSSVIILLFFSFYNSAFAYTMLLRSNLLQQAILQIQLYENQDSVNFSLYKLYVKTDTTLTT
jgi:hypothetical protein